MAVFEPHRADDRLVAQAQTKRVKHVTFAAESITGGQS